MNYNINLIIATAFIFLSSACSKDKISEPTPESDPKVLKGLFDTIFMYNNSQREYLLYIPESYDGTKAVPLVFSLHGAAGTKESQYALSRFHSVADTANFILVTPEATANPVTAWNSSSSPNRADDVGFLNALIDTLSNKYNIDKDRIYIAGSSNGGFMSYELACKLGHKVAAITSVKGAMLAAQMSNCNPSRPVPILEIHGTDDRNVPYDWAIDAINFWIGHNRTSSTPIITNFPDTKPNNGNTAQLYLYEAGLSGIGVEHIRVNGGVHDWFGEPGTDYDINATLEAWRFFLKYDLKGKR